MAAACRLHSNAAKALCDCLVDRIDLDTPPGQLIIYAGAVPSYADDAAGTEVATLNFGNTAYAAAQADGTNHWADANLTGGTAISDSSATGGTAAYFRIVTGTSGNVVLQGTVGTSDADLVLNSVTVGAGATVTVTALEVRIPYNQA